MHDLSYLISLLTVVDGAVVAPSSSLWDTQSSESSEASESTDKQSSESLESSESLVPLCCIVLDEVDDFYAIYIFLKTK